MVINLLDVRHLRAIELLLNGELTQEQIATEVGVDRVTLWDWRKRNKEFIAELSKRQQENSEFLKKSTQKKFDKKLDNVIDKLEHLINNSKNDNTVKDACIYWLERVVGKIPSKVEINETTDKEDDGISMIDEETESWDIDEK